MPGLIIPETIPVDDLPAIWSPVQWDLTESERAHELEDQAKGSLLWSVDVPEALLRLLLDETQITRLFSPPQGFDPEQQGEWDESLLTFGLERAIRLESLRREPDRLTIEYKLEGSGYWIIEVSPQRVIIEKV